MAGKGQKVANVEKAREEFGAVARDKLLPRGKAKHLAPNSLMDNMK